MKFAINLDTKTLANKLGLAVKKIKGSVLPATKNVGSFYRSNINAFKDGYNGIDATLERKLDK